MVNPFIIHYGTVPTFNLHLNMCKLCKTTFAETFVIFWRHNLIQFAPFQELSKLYSVFNTCPVFANKIFRNIYHNVRLLFNK